VHCSHSRSWPLPDGATSTQPWSAYGVRPGGMSARAAACHVPATYFGRQRVRRWARDDSMPLTRVLNLARLARSVARLEALKG
jgi:hypothetical protein